MLTPEGKQRKVVSLIPIVDILDKPDRNKNCYSWIPLWYKQTNNDSTSMGISCVNCCDHFLKKMERVRVCVARK
jgi:hypothetical protein